MGLISDPCSVGVVKIPYVSVRKFDEVVSNGDRISLVGLGKHGNPTISLKAADWFLVHFLYGQVQRKTLALTLLRLL